MDEQTETISQSPDQVRIFENGESSKLHEESVQDETLGKEGKQ